MFLFTPASKCDDISCSEVIRALRLEDDPELEAIEERLDVINDEKAEWEKKKKAAEKLAKGSIFLPPVTN
jgi:hypothetical protein